MKRIVGLIAGVLMIFTALSASAQINFGIKGGINISSVHFSSDIIESDNRTGFNIGPMLEVMVPYTGIGFDAAILYSQKGMDAGRESFNTDYIDVPVNFKWKFGLPVVKGYFAAGPYVGFRVGGDKIWDMPQNIGSQIKTKSFGAGLNLGLGVELLSHLQVGFNYGLGLTDNYSLKDTAGASEGGKHRGWTISAAILF
ncbi:hypothetical protein M2459_001832 [Parabacteroides sp. PF5-5]|uniref:porin family protein n=1 Tax=unclassified Parabacteroides TaxID=2649774 RepID=UPI002474A0AE|nr:MULTISPECIES: porin family protein [unclassified Parabacteroides]MDH6305379.1 hypothetical protein [Parabacteroides sp. PH5-39]MDH6316089.1 hypothetical protein [Parabacteroides sp. PF5-13]MDH6320239.1 hypothetical protein [Parabacteroides sp. PH5-13]MDH6323969.1 hypothetical protein [Parabacteroides sp. PH5-8]MDH6327280.1 hypothetical protein [Parabacteroides sp. PH5-41]